MSAKSRHSTGERFVARLTLICFSLGSNPAGAADTALGPVETLAGVGAVTIDTADHTTLSSETASVHYAWGSDFVQPAGHTLEFVQKLDGVLDSNAVAYNTSPGLRPTEFFGSVLANGTVIFANPAGVYFQDGSFVDVGNLIAGAGNLMNTPAPGADLGFTGLAGEVVNRGEIHAGSVSLLGARVANFGQIHVRDGSLMLLAGDEIWLTEHGSPIRVQLTSSADDPSQAAGDPLQPAVENAGSLDAGRGRVRLAAGDGLGFALRSSGSVRAREITLEGGDGGLVEVSGQLDASNLEAGARGGRIDVLGDFITLAAGAELDASGDAGGGQIRVGGDQQGQGDLRRATALFVSPDASLRADAIGTGDGGRIVLWSEEISSLWGTLSARGGLAGGSGGFVETSSRGWLDLQTTPDLQARSGQPGDGGGQWLIDPTNIRIIDASAACGDAPTCLDDGLDPEDIENPIQLNPYTNRYEIALRPSVDDSLVHADRIAQALAMGVDLTLSTQTFGSQPGLQEGNITVDGEIWIPNDTTWEVADDSHASLTLRATNHIFVHERIGTDHDELSLDVILEAADFDQPELPNEDGEIYNYFQGDLVLDAPITTHGGNVQLTGAGVQLAGAADITTEGGDIEIYAGGSTLRVESTLDSCLAAGCSSDEDETGGNVTLAASYPADLMQAIGEYVKGSGQVELLPGHVELADTARIRSGGGLVSLSAEGDLRLEGGAAIDSAGGSVRLESSIVGFTTDGVSQLAGGRVETGTGTSITTGGGALAILAGTGEVDREARIDLAGSLDTTSSEPGEVGGGIGITLAGSGQTRVAADVTTGGGAVLIEGDGLQVDSAQISTLDTQNAPDIEHGSIQLIAQSRLEILAGSSLSGSSLSLSAGQSGSGDLDFDASTPISLRGDRIGLAAGDGYVVGDGIQNDSARIRLGQAHFASADDPALAPERFSLLQDAALVAGDIPSLARFGDGSAGVIVGMEYSLESADHTIEIADASLVAGTKLTLNAGQGVDIAQLLSLASLDIEVAEDFTVDAALAQNISGSAAEISITAGALGNSESGSLLVEADLQAQVKLTLHAGAGGNGDLSFRNEGAPVQLRSDEIVLRAGSGTPDSATEPSAASRVLASSTEASAVQFRRGDGSAPPLAFTLRQDADIDDASLPETTQFGLGATEAIGNLRYTLRSDEGSITLDDASGLNRVQDSDLTLLARDRISLPDAGPGSLRVSALEIGGLDSFVFESTLLDKIAFTNPATSRLVLRAGFDPVSSGDSLGFGPDVTVSANEVRLVAGDGLGGSFDDAWIRLADDVAFVSPGAFVFEQDASISASASANPLPTLADHFGAGAPATFALRSDAGAITLTDMSLLIPATSLVLLSADTVQMQRTDGEDLDFGQDFGTGVAVEIRAATVDLASNKTTPDGAYASDPVNAAQVKPGSLQLRGFDGGEGAAELDWTSTPATSPDLISLRQDADISVANLIDADQVGAGFRPRDAAGNRVLADLDGDGELESLDPVRYELTSRFGSIALTADKVGSTGAATDFGSDLWLELSSVPNEGLEGYTAPVRKIELGGDSYRLESLHATTPDAFQVTANTEVTAWDTISLEAGTRGTGDLGFDSFVSLTARAIELLAGGAGALTDEDGTPLAPPVVDARSNAPSFTLVNNSDPGAPLPAGELATSFAIRQDGSLVDATPASGESQVPGASQLAGDIGIYRLESRLRDIAIDDLANLPAADLGTTTGTRLEIVASSTAAERPGRIRIGNGGTGDLDFTPYASASLTADLIELVATGVGSRVLADNEAVSFERASSDENSALGFSLSQEAALDASSLPQRDQFAAGLIRVDYHAQSTGGSIAIDPIFAARVNGSDLSLTGAGDLVFEAPGDTLDLDLASLHATSTGGVLSVSDADIATSGDQTWDADVVLTGDLSLLGVDVVFSGDVTGAGHDLHLITAGHSAFRGDVGAAAAPLAQLRVDFDSSSGDIARLQFGDDSATDQGVWADSILFQAVTPDASGAIPGPRSIPVASLFKRAGNLDFDATGDFTMGEGEKLSVAGNVRITAGAEARIGDISAFDITVDATTIAIVRRAGGAWLDAKGRMLEDAGIDFVANRITWNGDVLLTGSGANPSFALPDPLAAPAWLQRDGEGPLWGQHPLPDRPGEPDWTQPFSVTAIHSDKSPLTSADFAWRGGVDDSLFPDLHPNGPTSDSIDTTFYGQDLVPSPSSVTTDTWLPASEAALLALDIRTRATTAHERRRLLEGAFIVDDVGLDLLFAGDPAIHVAENRVIARDADRAVALYEKVFGPDGARAEHVRGLMQQAVDQYRRSSGSRRVVGFELRRYVKNRPSSLFEAYQTLEDLDSLFRHHRALGLTPGEYGPVQHAWLESIRPDGISLEELSEAIHPSRYVRGSDILDIFGN